MQIDQLYQEIVLEHYKRPHGRGLREPFQAEAHHVNPTCGDEVTLRVDLQGDRVADVSYDGMGCSISQASASVLYDLVNDRPLDEAMVRHDAFVALLSGRGQVEPDEELLEDGVAFSGVAKYPARVKCALLPWMAFKDALARAGGAAGAGRWPADAAGAGRRPADGASAGRQAADSASVGGSV